MSYKVRFIDVNDIWMRYLIVCVDKTWGQSGCQPWTGDWVDEVWLQPGQYVDSPYFTPNTVLTAVTSSDAGYYYKVEIIDQNGNVVKTCDYVDRNNPCYYYVSAPPSPSPTAPPSPSPSPSPSPTIPPPPSPPSPSPSPPPTPGTVNITEANHPDTVYVNQEFSWYVVGQVQNGYVTNPAVGYYYISGPASSITIIDVAGNEHYVSPGQIIFVYLTGTQPPGTTIDSRLLYRYAVYPQTGTYQVALVAGYYNQQTGQFTITDQRYYTVTCTTPTIPSPSPSPSPSPPTPPPTPPPSPPPTPPPSPSPSPSPPSPTPSPSPPPGLSTTDLLIIAGVLAASALIGFGVTYAVRQASKK